MCTYIWIISNVNWISMAKLPFWYTFTTLVMGIVDTIRTSIIHMNPEVRSTIFCETSVINNPLGFWFVTLCISAFVAIKIFYKVSVFTCKNPLIEEKRKFKGNFGKTTNFEVFKFANYIKRKFIGELIHTYNSHCWLEIHHKMSRHMDTNFSKHEIYQTCELP